jgi:peptide deformylase
MQENERLVQYSELKPTTKVDSPEIIPAEVLAKWWGEAKQTCRTHGFTAIAFNEMPQSVLSNLGFENKNPSIIYFSKVSGDKKPISEELLINPEIQTVDVLGDTLSVEGCGSIIDMDGIGPRMFVVRPAVIFGAAYFWKPGKKSPSHREFLVVRATSSVIQHEAKHLEGKSALSNPDQIMDFTDKHVLRELIEKYRITGEDFLLELLPKYNHWLVYDKLSDKFKLIGSDGKFIRNEFNKS